MFETRKNTPGAAANKPYRPNTRGASCAANAWLDCMHTWYQLTDGTDGTSTVKSHAAHISSWREGPEMQQYQSPTSSKGRKPWDKLQTIRLHTVSEFLREIPAKPTCAKQDIALGVVPVSQLEHSQTQHGCVSPQSVLPLSASQGAQSLAHHITRCSVRPHSHTDMPVQCMLLHRCEPPCAALPTAAAVD